MTTPPRERHVEGIDVSQSSIGDLLGEVTSDLSTLMRQEVELAKAGTATYTVVARSASGTNFKIDKGASGASTRTCDKPGTGGCPAGGSW